MKKFILLGLAIVFFASCNEKQRYTQQSSEIDTYKKVMDDYRKKDWTNTASFYADTAKIANNMVKEKALTVAQALEQNKEDAKLFDWKVEDNDAEMVVTDKGETWVNYWGTWRGTMKSTGKVYVIPFHSTAQFIEGKIVKEDGYWNTSEIVADMLQQPKTSTPTETVSEK